MTVQPRPPLSEHELIARYFRPLVHDAGALGLLDDAAFLMPPTGHDVVLSVDAIVEGVHFLAGETPERIARRALRVNISDLIAKGADPVGYLLTLSLPHETPESWVAAFAQGLAEDQSRYGIGLLGGDSVRGPDRQRCPVMVSITIVGHVPAGQGVRRAGAAIGDSVVVTGTIGDATLGLRIAQGDALPGLTHVQGRTLEHAYRTPEPPFGIAAALRLHAHAAMDVSDGLVGDLDKLCLASGVSARIETERVPLSAEAQTAVEADPGLLSSCLSGGDDYQVLAAMPEEAFEDFAQACDKTGIRATMIGWITDPVSMMNADGVPLALTRRAYSHQGH